MIFFPSFWGCKHEITKITRVEKYYGVWNLQCWIDKICWIMGLEENWFRLNSLDFLFYCWWKNNFWIWRVAKHEKQEQEYWIIRIKIEVILFVKVWFFSVWENKFGYIKFNSFNNYIYLWRGYFFFTNYPMKLRKERWKIRSVKFTFSTT